MTITAFQLAERFVGVADVAGAASNPQVLAMLRLVNAGVVDDDTPWCSAFVNYVAWLLRLPRSYSLRARSWLQVGRPLLLSEALPQFDVVILERGAPAPATVVDAPGHVGFFAGLDERGVHLLGGNQGDRVSVAQFPLGRVLGVRRLYDETPA